MLEVTGQADWEARIRDLRTRADRLAAEPEHRHRDAAVLAVELLKHCWVAITPAVVAASCRTALRAGHPAITLPRGSAKGQQVPATLQRYLEQVAAEPAEPPDPLEPADLGDEPVETWECGHAPGDEPPPPAPAPAPAPPPPPSPVTGDWLTVAAMAERVGLRRSGLQRLLSTMADRLIEDQHFSRFHGRVLWHQSAVEVLQDRPRKIKRSPEEKAALNRDRARRWREATRAEREERRQAISDQAAADALDKLLPILLAND